MSQRRFRIVDVFTDRPLAGNQLGVVLDGDGLEVAAMQAIAREFNFSETTFVGPPSLEGCDRAVRIFTPVRELPIAGHPVVGTALVLHGEGLVGPRMVLELGVGPTPVEVDGEGRAWMTFPAAVFGAVAADPGRLAAAVSLGADDVRPDLPAQAVSCGNEFCFLPLASVEALGRCQPDLTRWNAVAEASSFQALYCFVAVAPGRIRARMFAPTMGIVEDAATGSGAAPLGAYMAREQGWTRFRIEQGAEMGRPSLLHVEVGEGRGPKVGGTAVVAASGELASGVG